jgi:hypothetical protein
MLTNSWVFRGTIKALMAPFEPDGVYCNIPYRVLPDSSIEAMMSGGLVKYKNMDQFLAASGSATAYTNVGRSVVSYDLLGNADERNSNIPSSMWSLDYYSILREAIKTAEHSPSQLRALVYERARFNLKRDILYGHSSMGLAEVVQHVKEFELAVARIESNVEGIDPRSPQQTAWPDETETNSRDAVEILPATRTASRYAELSPIRWSDNFQHVRLPDEFLRYLRSANRFIGFAILGMAFIGAIVVLVMLWPLPKASHQIETTNKVPQVNGPAVTQTSLSENDLPPTEASTKLPFPLPTSFGIYVLNDNKLTELEALPINVPDPRVAISAEIKTPSTVTISEHKPVFILFRRDLLNNAPQKVMLRVVARMAQETKIVNNKPVITKIEGAWRIRNVSHELKIFPIPGQREMVVARLDDEVSLPAGRFALVMNRLGYDFTIDGPEQAPESCLEGFEAATGNVFTQCRTR